MGFCSLKVLAERLGGGERRLGSRFDDLLRSNLDENGYVIQKDCFPHYLAVTNSEATDGPIEEYTVTDAPLNITFPAYRAYPGSCDITYRVVGELASIARVTDQLNRIVTIYAEDDYLLRGRSKARLQVPIEGSIGGFFSVTAVSHFDIMVFSPCYKPSYV